MVVFGSLLLSFTCPTEKSCGGVGHQERPARRNEVAAAAAKPLQLCPTLCDPIDVSPPGSHAPGILQARALEWGAIESDTIKQLN